MSAPRSPTSENAATDSPLGHRSLRELVAEEIRGMILRGELEAGERLVEDKLAEQLEVSRNPVREAIRSLEATGLVEVIPRRGAYVSRIDGDDIHQIQELRAAIDGYAAELAAARRTDEELAALTRRVEEGLAASEAGDHLRSAELHREFHTLLEQAAGNRYLPLALTRLRHGTEMVFLVLLEQRGGVSWDEHRRILDAIAAGDGRHARFLMESHILSTLELFEHRPELTPVHASSHRIEGS